MLVNSVIEKLLANIADLNVVVLGEVVLDCCWQGDAPTLIVNITKRVDVPGGAAATALQFQGMGGKVKLLSVVGDDCEGSRLCEFLKTKDVSTQSVLVESGRQTLTKQRVTATSQILVSFEAGSCDPIASSIETELISQLKAVFPQSDVVIVCDRSAGLITPNVIQALSQLQTQSPRILMIHSENLAAYHLLGVQAESQVVVIDRDRIIPCHLDQLQALITLPSPPQHQSSATKQIFDTDTLIQLVADYRQAGRKLVFTNGCFDILHAGHVSYLNRAKALGDVLIIGVNSDASIRKIKGDSRPINPLEDRMQVLAGLGCVDHLIPFAESSPTHLLRLVRPDVYVKGGDYTLETLPEAPLIQELGGEIALLSVVENRSTTRIIERINASSREEQRQ